MTAVKHRSIVPADYPTLKQLVWSRDPSRPIPAEEVLSIYERNWRFIDETRLSEREAALIGELADAFGAGRLMKP